LGVPHQTGINDLAIGINVCQPLEKDNRDYPEGVEGWDIDRTHLDVPNYLDNGLPIATGEEGLEPPTDCLEGSCSIRLSYSPTLAL
jgi:hypothetical protein